MAANALLARAMSKSEFSSIGLAFGIYFFVYGFHRANVVLPFLLDGPNEISDDGGKHDRWFWFNLCSVGAAALVLVLVAGAANALFGSRPAMQWVVRALVYSVFVCPTMLLTEFSRRWLYQAQMPIWAAVGSFVFLVINVGMAAAVYLWRLPPLVGATSWAAASAGLFLTSAVVRPPKPGSLRDLPGVWKPHARVALWQSLNHLPYTLYNNSVIFLIGAFGGAAAAASFTVARTLSSPVLSVTGAVDMLDKPRAVRALAQGGVAGLKSSIGRTRRLLAGLNGGYTVVLLALTPALLSLIFGASYARNAPEVRLLALAFFLSSMNQPSESILLILGGSRNIFSVRLSTALSAVLALALGGLLFGSVGCVAMLVAVQTLNLVLLTVTERSVTRRANATTG